MLEFLTSPLVSLVTIFFAVPVLATVSDLGSVNLRLPLIEALDLRPQKPRVRVKAFSKEFKEFVRMVSGEPPRG